MFDQLASDWRRLEMYFIGYGAYKTHQLAWLSATQLVVFSDCEEVRRITNYHGIVVEKRDSK